MSHYVVEARYAEGAADKRAPHRDAHLERLRKLAAEGVLVLAGAFSDLSATLLVFAVGSEEAVVAIIQSDVYWKNKVWTDYSIRSFKASLDG